MNPRLFILQPAVMMRGQVNMASIVYPLEHITYDNVTIGGHLNVKPSMTVIFGSAPGMDDLGRYKIVSISSSNFYMGLVPTGVPGDGVLDIYDDCYFDILREYRVWAKIPWFNPTDHTDERKDGNFWGVGDKTLKPSPVANAGGPVAGTVDPDTGYLIANFSGANSFQFDEPVSTGMGAVDAYLWDVQDGDIVSGTTTSEDIIATFPPGFRYVSLRVTKNYGEDPVHHTTYVPVYVRDPENDTSFEADIVTLNRGREGQQVTVKLHQEIDRSDYRDGSVILVWDDDAYDQDTTRDSILIYGWLSTETSSTSAEERGDIIETTLQIEDVASKMRNTPAYSQALEYNETPTKWFHTKFPHMAYYIWYLLHWHSTVLDVADLYWPYPYSMAGLQFEALTSDAGDLFSQVNAVANAMTPDHMVNCTRIGQLLITYDPVLQTVGLRDEDVDLTIEPWEIHSFNYSYTPFSRIGEITTYAELGVLGVDPSERGIACKVPTDGRGHGVQHLEIANKIAPSQGALNDCEGHRFAKLNTPYGPVSLQIGFNPNYLHLIDPAFNKWVMLSIPPENLSWRDKQGSFIDGRGLITNVQFSFSNQEGGTVGTISIIWERETQGLPGSLYDPPTVLEE